MPRSKWHSTPKSNQATQGPKISKTRLTTKTEQIEAVQQTQVHHTITITSSEKSRNIILVIQEPQQKQEVIEIPLTNSMNITENSLNKNKLLNKTKLLNNNNNNSIKSQRTLIQIPQQNSKPRIFLLTRPSKPQLVRLETQAVQPHPKKKLILSLPHHPHKKVTTSPVSAPSQKQTEIIRIPFLTRTQVQTFSVKNNTNQIPKKDLNQAQVKEQIENLPEKPIILKQVIHLSPSLRENSSNQLHTQQPSAKNTITKNSLENLNLSETNFIENQAQAQSERPLTLASMAGIELTGADMSLSQADMSGAMPPTATVEEINVPVFIDEYLQEASASTTSVTTNNFLNINNTSNSNNISNNNLSNETGNEVNNFLDTLDNFEFDINLLTENNSKDRKTATLEEKVDQLHQQQQLSEVDEDKQIKQHQMELQMMLEKFLFCNNNNNNSNNNNNNNNMAEIDFTDEVFKVAPYTEINDLLSPDDIESSSFGTTQFNSEEAVDLNSISKDFTLDDCFINSQPTEIMFSSGYSQSQNLIHEISQAEPHIIPKYSTIATTSEKATAIKMEDCELSDEMDAFYTSEYNVDDNTANCKETKSLVSSPLKRRSSQTSQHMLEKRLKLRLDTKSCRENILSQQSEITTPKVIDFIDQFNDDTSMGTTAADSIKTIYFDLISSSPKCVSVKSEINIDDTTNDFSPPNTPYSVNSISNQTSLMNTAPNSPASSIATISNTSTTNTKRGRGRPAKTHSDIPDRSQIQHLSESEQKKVLERAKNNEASRKSRLKHKERDNALEREELELKVRNEELEKEWEKWKNMEKKLKAAMKRQYYQFRNDQ